MEVRTATPDELATVMGVFDGAMLATEIDAVREAIEQGDLLVAVEAERILGACLLVGAEIDAIAVRQGRRGQGIGSALIKAAGERRDRLVARFDPEVRPFWESLSFEIEPTADTERYRGVRKRDDETGE